MGFKRKHSRVDIGRNGRLQRGSLSAPCTVLDVSESGFRIESRLYVKAGETLQLVIELPHGRTLACAVKPVHVRPPRFGAQIISISPEDQEQLAHMLDDRIQHFFSAR